MMNYDDILEELGEFGPWQITIALILWLPAAIDGIQILMFSFTGLPPDKFRCKIDGCDLDNFSYGDFSEDIFPRLENGEPDYCSYYLPEKDALGQCSKTSFRNDTVFTCSGDIDYAFDTFEMDNTVVTDFKVVCDKNIMLPVVNSFFMIGLMIGSFSFGVLSDKFGRRHMLVVAIICCSGGSLIGSFMPEFYTYVLFRMIAAIGAEGCFLIPFSLSMEIVGVKEKVPFLPWVTYNTLLANIFSVPLAGGETLISILAMFIPAWRTLQWTSSLGCLALAVIWFFVPESPRWLIANGKYTEAQALVQRAAKRNKVTISEHLLTGTHKKQPSDDFDKVEKASVEGTDLGLRDLFHPSIRVITLVMFICWPVVTLLYYGISFSVDKISLTDDVFVSNILISIIEIPSYIALVLAMDIWGRKPLFVLTMLIPGAACIIAAFLKTGTVFTILVLVGKFCIAAAFNITYMYTAELFPTVIRNSAIGSCSTMARFGGILAPWVAVYLPDQGSLPDWVAYTIFGVASAIGGLLALLLPETLGAPLPDSFQDLEDMKKNSKPMWKCVLPWRQK